MILKSKSSKILLRLGKPIIIKTNILSTDCTSFAIFLFSQSLLSLARAKQGSVVVYFNLSAPTVSLLVSIHPSLFTSPHRLAQILPKNILRRVRVLLDISTHVYMANCSYLSLSRQKKRP